MGGVISSHSGDYLLINSLARKELKDIPRVFQGFKSEVSSLTALHNRRCETEILAQILNTAIGGAIKTKILYKTQLSGRQMKKYLSFLLEHGLIKKDGIRKRGDKFFTTLRGGLFLIHWIKILCLIENIQTNYESLHLPKKR